MTTMIVFPGQGSQAVGMAASFMEEALTRPLFEEARDVLGFDLPALMREGPAEALTQTENAQPALLLAGVAAWHCLMQDAAKVVQPVGVAGHSLGEYTAAVAARCMGLADGLRLVRARGMAMRDAAKGGMVAVLGLDGAACAAVAEECGVWLANLNSPAQSILAGEDAGLARVEAAAKARGAKRVLRLPVGGAFHTPLMAGAAEVVRAKLAEMALADPRFPVWGCATAAPALTAAEVGDNLVAQITAPVRWHGLMEKAIAQGTRTVLELGSGNVLTNLAKRMDGPDGAVHAVSLDSVEAIRAYAAEHRGK